MPAGRFRFALIAAAMVAFLLVPAAQAFANEHLKVNVEGSGKGKVIISPALEHYKGSPEINCSYASPGPATGVCTTEMSDEGEGFEQVFVEGKAEPGSRFAGWTIQHGEYEGCAAPPNLENHSGCAPYVEPSGSGGDNSEITAIFESTPALTIAKTGEGTVTSSPAGIVCTGAKTGAECVSEFKLNEMVTLTASPATGYAFSAWAGCTSHTGLTCTVEMSKAKTVKVTFVATPSLSIEKAGTGQGKVMATGISCDENCSKASSAVKTGTAVTVKVTPAKGSEAAVFEGGTGSAGACTGGTCSFPISENSSVKVKFAAIPTKTLTVKLTGPAAYKGKVSGKGTVKGLTASAISCGTGCTTDTESFFSSDTVTLTAVAGTGYTFAGWSGSGCSGTGTCTVATSSDKTVSAEFK